MQFLEVRGAQLLPLCLRKQDLRTLLETAVSFLQGKSVVSHQLLPNAFVPMQMKGYKPLRVEGRNTMLLICFREEWVTENKRSLSDGNRHYTTEGYSKLSSRATQNIPETWISDAKPEYCLNAERVTHYLMSCNIVKFGKIFFWLPWSAGSSQFQGSLQDQLRNLL